MSELTNTTYDELAIGQTATFTREVTQRDIQLFAAASGDLNPLHLDPEYAAGTQFGERIAHGMLTGGLFSAALAMALPGPGCLYRGQTLRFRLPVKIGDVITVALEVTDKRDRTRLVTLDCKAANQDGKLVTTGTAEVIAPTEKLVLPIPEPPSFD